MAAAIDALDITWITIATGFGVHASLPLETVAGRGSEYRESRHLCNQRRDWQGTLMIEDTIACAARLPQHSTGRSTRILGTWLASN